MHHINELTNFNPETGESDWTASESENGLFRRGEPQGWPKGYLWKVRRVIRGQVIEKSPEGSDRGPILAIRTIGKREKSHTNAINTRCRRAHKDKPCVFTGMTSAIEIDHRAGNKDHPLHVDACNPDTQEPEDFMPVSKTLNIIKRQKCKKCVATGERPAPPPFLGLARMIDGPGCHGCYWFDPDLYSPNNYPNEQQTTDVLGGQER